MLLEVQVVAVVLRLVRRQQAAAGGAVDAARRLVHVHLVRVQVQNLGRFARRRPSFAFQNRNHVSISIDRESNFLETTAAIA